MLKRKFGDRSDWKRVIVREYAQTFIDSERFTGHVTLLRIIKVTDPLYVIYHGEKICIADDGYEWLQQFPSDRNHSVTTMFDSKGNIVQWYIDICSLNGVSENDVPWMDDLFLDLIVLPTGKLIKKDANELEEALISGTIDKNLYDLAWKEANRLSELIEHDEFTIIKLSELHREILCQKLKSIE